jgi:hypothetical protein
MDKEQSFDQLDLDSMRLGKLILITEEASCLDFRAEDRMSLIRRREIKSKLLAEQLENPQDPQDPLRRKIAPVGARTPLSGSSVIAKTALLNATDGI